MTGGLPFYFNENLNSSNDSSYFKFTGRLFYKTFPLNFDEVFLHCSVFNSGIKRKLYVCHMNPELSLFLD